MRSLNALIFLGALGALGGCGSVDTKSTVDAAPAHTVACDATSHTVSVLMNGSFDAPTPAWTQDPPALLCGKPTITPFDGAASACLGGMDGMTDTLSMSIPLPAGITSLTLNGERCISTQSTAATNVDTLTFDVLAGDVVIATLGMFTNQQGLASCSFEAFTLQTQITSDPASATLRIRSNLDESDTTSFFIDALALDAGCAP